eukprot:UN23068
MCGTEGMKNYFAHMSKSFKYRCNTVDKMIFLYMIEPYHDRREVTVNETAYKLSTKH